MKITISEEKLRNLIESSLGLALSEIPWMSSIQYITTEGVSVKLREIILGNDDLPDEDRHFAVRSENWKKPENLTRLMKESINSLETSVRLHNCLVAQNFSKIWQLVIGSDCLIQAKGFGKTTHNELKHQLAELPGYNEDFRLRLRDLFLIWLANNEICIDRISPRWMSEFNRNVDLVKKAEDFLLPEILRIQTELGLL